MALPKIPLLQSSAMVCIVFVHAALLYMLYHFHPTKQLATRSATKLQYEQVTQITFITRPVPKPLQIEKPIEHSAAAHHQEAVYDSIGLQAEFRETKSQERHANENTSKDLKPLNLNLPDVAIDFSPKQRDILERPRNTVEYQSTRFNDRFKPSGNAIDSLKWKSKTFNFITGILGGNQKICTDEDRKNRLPECVPDAYKPED